MPERTYINKQTGKDVELLTELFECNVCSHKDIETTVSKEWRADNSKPKYKKRCRLCRNIWFVNERKNPGHYVRKDLLSPEEIKKYNKPPRRYVKSRVKANVDKSEGEKKYNEIIKQSLEKEKAKKAEALKKKEEKNETKA